MLSGIQQLPIEHFAGGTTNQVAVLELLTNCQASRAMGKRCQFACPWLLVCPCVIRSGYVVLVVVVLLNTEVDGSWEVQVDDGHPLNNTTMTNHSDYSIPDLIDVVQIAAVF